MLKFLESKYCTGLEYFLPVLNNKTATEGQMIRDFEKSLFSLNLFLSLFHCPHAS